MNFDKTKEKWLVALRSGDYKQGKSTLWDAIDNTYCCLGVLCSCAGASDEIIEDYNTLLDFCNPLLDSDELALLGEFIGADNEAILVKMNDDESRSFHDIADWIETNI